MKTKAELREKARQLLRDHRIEEPPVPVDRLARDLGAEIRYSPYEGTLAGMVYRQGRGILIGVNSAHPITRQRFTIAHEIGHILLHGSIEAHIDRDFGVRINMSSPNDYSSLFPALSYSLAGPPVFSTLSAMASSHHRLDAVPDMSRVGVYTRDPTHGISEPEEVEANRFAAELLMPYEMLGKEVGRLDVEDEREIRRLAERYSVSIQAMTIRISAFAENAI